MTTSPSDHDREPLAREITALHRVLYDLMQDVNDIEKRAPLVARVATAGIQAARARHAIGSADAALLDRILEILKVDNVNAPTDESAGASGPEAHGDAGI